MRIVALLYALSWVAVRGMLVCGCPASKGGILRAISPAGRRFRASALVSGRKNHDVYAYMCTFFLVFAFRDARFLSGLYGRFSYIVIVRTNVLWLRSPATAANSRCKISIKPMLKPRSASRVRSPRKCGMTFIHRRPRRSHRRCKQRDWNRLLRCRAPPTWTRCPCGFNGPSCRARRLWLCQGLHLAQEKTTRSSWATLPRNLLPLR